MMSIKNIYRFVLLAFIVFFAIYLHGVFNDWLAAFAMAIVIPIAVIGLFKRYFIHDPQEWARMGQENEEYRRNFYDHKRDMEIVDSMQVMKD